MWLFWICAGALAAAAALLVASRAAGAARLAQVAEDPALGVHRRALSELDELAARGLVAPSELAGAQAEAGRRLLSAADVARRPERPALRGSRGAVTAGAVLASLLALGAYLLVGAPGYPDQPYARRLAGWSAPSGLERLDPARLAAVLEAVTLKRPDDPRAFDFLGRARMAAGDFGSAAQAFEHAARLAPTNAIYPSEAGEALLQGQEGKVPVEAQAAFREALRRDPKNAAARYHLARARMAAGDVAGGLAEWRALAADIPVDDRRRADLLAEIAQAQATGALPVQAAQTPTPSTPLAAGPTADQVAAAVHTAPEGGPEQAAFIRSMVAARAARLKANPDDPAGWALLVRSYGVLGDAAAQAQALAQARIALAKRPDALARVEAQAQVLGHPPGGSR